ncbi:hypothetical protein PT2222_460004 [Paraburkholderia tropica]
MRAQAAARLLAQRLHGSAGQPVVHAALRARNEDGIRTGYAVVVDRAEDRAVVNHRDLLCGGHAREHVGLDGIEAGEHVVADCSRHVAGYTDRRAMRARLCLRGDGTGGEQEQKACLFHDRSVEERFPAGHDPQAVFHGPVCEEAGSAGRGTKAGACGKCDGR